jgi:hypothetical protein
VGPVWEVEGELGGCWTGVDITCWFVLLVCFVGLFVGLLFIFGGPNLREWSRIGYK